MSTVATSGMVSACTVISCCIGFLVSCSSPSYEEAAFRTARQDRSVKTLHRFVRDHDDDEYRGLAKELIDKQYEHVIEHLPEGRHVEFNRVLLTHLRQAGDPRVAIQVSRPTFDPADAVPLSYFSSEHLYDYMFRDAAERVVAKIFPYQVVVFATTDYDYEPGPETVAVHVDWSVGLSGSLFQGAMNFGLTESAPIPGISVRATLRFLIPGTEPFVFTGVGSPLSFDYEAFLGMPNEDDLFSGMTESAFEKALEQIWL